MIRSMKSKILLATLLCISMGAFASMYRWVDDNGQVHYTQHPPKKGEVKVIPPPLKAASTADEESKRFLELDKQIEEQKKLDAKAREKQAQSTEKKQILKQNCSLAKQRFSQLNKSSKFRDAYGNLTQLTPAGKEAELRKVQAEIEIYCQ